MKSLNDKFEVYGKNIRRKINIGNNENSVIFIVEDAPHAIIDGREQLLDEELLNSMIRRIAMETKNMESKYNRIPEKITISRKSTIDEKSHEKKKEDSPNENIVDIQKSRYTMDDVCIKEKPSKEIMSALTLVEHKDIIYRDWGLEKTFKNGRSVVLNFYGKPGTGKSMMAEAIAGQLGKKYMLANYSELESKYVGETPKNIRNIFQIASKEDAVLVFDEADSFLGKRLTNVSQSADYGVNITRSVMLLELEKFEGIVIFTTNLLSNYDEAFKRRILANIEFEMPDADVRSRIWNLHLNEKLPLECGIDHHMLGAKYDGITGADIKDIMLFAAVGALSNSENRIGIRHFDSAYEIIKNRYAQTDWSVTGHERVTKEQMEAEIQNGNII